jgi:Mrp family chromosome partitioning ATPase
VLTDESVELSQVLMRTNVDKLSLLPSGTQHPRATELLASEAMIKLLDEMANRYPDRIIIFDSPATADDYRIKGAGEPYGAGGRCGEGRTHGAQ